jgi:hypothetical protein
MLDHALVDLIATIRRGFEAALLERQAVEERFQVDVFLGDVSFETSYSLPGEGSSPRVRADLSLDWPTWSQSAYRSWSIGEPPEALPEVVVEVALRVQRLAGVPDPARILAVLPESSPPVLGETLERSSPMIEQVYDNDGAAPRCAVEVCYEGTWTLDESVLDDPAALDTEVAALGTWVASTLVRLCDLDLEFLPPDEEDEA